ncbi:Transcriptional regulatory protein-like protein [Emericellopsis cladophorae]|uniref:Transcriptional regulatory protein-like protein n=1 Tax=Emericellopsis cladophorae TaxID=2686198 RepID=A0A9P9XYG5_9HYPO|nr:Transcriptional regulatory protein-like protein [Emericellopsis cladophorae]KAI6779654.1 Transcriptional regulatory protein-like protein [Emericellopsis cladophorae]
MCRTRRIKCDETKPTCNQCAKSRRVCPGYKDEFDLVFRNETQATERRARKANKKATAQKINPDATMTVLSPDGSPSGKQLQKSPSPAQSSYVASALQLPLDQQASCHFVSNYVLIPRQGSTRGFMEYLLPLMKTERPAEHFKNAFDACAFASLGNRVGVGHDFGEIALSRYTKALSSTYKALRDPELAKQDSTLAAILLLGLFENISAKQLGMLAWGSHIEGAIQLVRARGKKQLRTKAGLHLFIAVRTQMIIHTLSSGKSPIMGVDWWINDAVKDESAASCQRIAILVGELRAEVNRLLGTLTRTAENIELILDLMRKCQLMDQECVAWSKDLPECFEFTTVAWEDNVPNGDYSKAEVFPGRVDAYQDLWLPSVWNLMRTSRIILASLIVRGAAWVCAPLDYRTTPEYATAARTCVECITDILASVPFQLGWFANRKHLLERANLSSFICGHEDAEKGLPGYFLTWPLTCVLGQDYATDSQRAWVRGRLELIGNQLGVRYAHMLTQLNLRIPSMLIRRDGLMAKHLPTGPDFEKLLSSKNTSAAEYQAKQKAAMQPPGQQLLNPLGDQWPPRSKWQSAQMGNAAAQS